MQKISKNLSVYEGVVNVGVLSEKENDGKTLLIDCASGVVEAVGSAERVLFTHGHRDQTAGLDEFAVRPKVYAPAAERAMFENASERWTGPEAQYHLYNDRPTPPLLTESMHVDGFLEDGDCVEWGGALVWAVATPGHTDGGMSYLIDADGVRAAFTGDLIYGPGQVWDVHSMQKRFAFFTDYHGFLGTRDELIGSLRRVLEWKPDVMVPSHGAPIEDSSSAVDLLAERLERCYDRYVAASAVRHYFPEVFGEFDGAEGHMPFGETLETPAFLRKIGTTWAVLSENGEAFVMDCGTPRVVDTFEKWIEAGEISKITGFWITHYHDDHVDGVPEFQRRFDVPTWASPVVADVVKRPRDWRIPCLSEAEARVDHEPADGESWRWNEFWMTSFFFPGQTYYHGGLLVQGRGMRLLFAGDSFTPSGMDDYCAANRNLLGEGVGYDRCLTLMDRLKPTHVFNCHVEQPFRFTSGQLQAMRALLREREALFGELAPWDHANYGLDPHWARCDPYAQTVQAGETAAIRVEITNHSADASTTQIRPLLPSGWRVQDESGAVPVKAGGLAAEIRTPAKSVGGAAFRLTIPSNADAKRTPIPFHIVHRGRDLGPFREAVLDIETP